MYGHDIGDMVLIEASKRLQSIIENTYRLGGDEFVCVATYKNESELRNLAKNEFDIKKRADLAMYRAKQAGKNRFHFYSEVA